MKKRDYTLEEKKDVLAIVLASTHYLNKKMPEHWKFMKEEEILDFISNNLWVPFEGQDAETVYSNIKRLAKDFQNYNDYFAAQKGDIKIVVSSEQ